MAAIAAGTGAAAAPPPLCHSSAAVGQLAAASPAFTATLDTQKVCGGVFAPDAALMW